MRWYPLCCPVTDVAAATDAGVKGATDVAATAAADAGTAAALDAGTAAAVDAAATGATAGLADAASTAVLAPALADAGGAAAGLGGAAAAGGIDAATQAAIDAGFTSASSSLGESALAGAAGAGGVGTGTTATLGSTAAGLGGEAAAPAAAAGGTLPEISVTGTALPAAGGSVGPALASLGATALPAVADAAASGGGRTPSMKDAGGGDSAPPDVGPIPGVDTPLDPNTLFAASDPTVNPLTYTGGAIPGVDAPIDPGAFLEGLDTTPPVDDPEFYQALTSTPSGGMQLGSPSFMQQLGNYLTSPKGLLTTGLSGASLLTALMKPKLPGASAEAGALAGPAAAQAESVIQTGGMGSPTWNAQKSSIDAQIDQEIKNATAAIQQANINRGMGGPESAATQQEIATVTGQLNVQRQQLYAQTLTQNVNNAIQELTGANATLMAVGNLEYTQSEEAKALAAQLAEYAAYLNVA